MWSYSTDGDASLLRLARTSASLRRPYRGYTRLRCKRGGEYSLDTMATGEYSLDTLALRDRMKVDPYRNANQIPINSGNESDPRVPQKPSFELWGPRT